jgi:hypothetical protein
METDGISGRGNEWNVEMWAMDGKCAGMWASMDRKGIDERRLGMEWPGGRGWQEVSGKWTNTWLE